MDILPLFLAEAVVTLYPADAAGNPVTASPVWVGSLATGLNLRRGMEEELSFASGDNFKTARHVDEIHIIEIAQNWFIRKTAPDEDATPQRNSTYVLDIVWSAPDELDNWYWHQRRYFGVTLRAADLNSNGTRHFGKPLVFRAQNFTTTGGQTAGTPPAGAPPLSPPGIPPTLPPTTPVTDDVLFLKENPLMNGDYLMGRYRWSSAKTITSATVIALASQDAATEFTLEVNGSLTAIKLTLVTAAANTEVSATASNINLAVPANQSVRWMVTNGPDDSATAAWKAALVMEIK